MGDHGVSKRPRFEHRAQGMMDQLTFAPPPPVPSSPGLPESKIPPETETSGINELSHRRRFFCSHLQKIVQQLTELFARCFLFDESLASSRCKWRIYNEGSLCVPTRWGLFERRLTGRETSAPAHKPFAAVQKAKIISARSPEGTPPLLWWTDCTCSRFERPI